MKNNMYKINKLEILQSKKGYQIKKIIYKYLYKEKCM